MMKYDDRERYSDRLSIEHCQKVLGKSEVEPTDEQVAKVWNFLYLLAEIKCEHYQKESNREGDNDDCSKRQLLTEKYLE